MPSSQTHPGDAYFFSNFRGISFVLMMFINSPPLPSGSCGCSAEGDPAKRKWKLLKKIIVLRKR